MIIGDKHKLGKMVVGVKTISIPAKECETIGIGTTNALQETSLY